MNIQTSYCKLYCDSEHSFKVHYFTAVLLLPLRIKTALIQLLNAQLRLVVPKELKQFP